MREELGVSQKTIDAALKTSKPEVRRLVGTDGNFRRADWPDKGLGGADRQACGNCAETYDRNVGVNVGHPARPEPELAGGRHPLCPADPVMWSAGLIGPLASFLGWRRRGRALSGQCSELNRSQAGAD
jgi:hypothetical protein